MTRGGIVGPVVTIYVTIYLTLYGTARLFSKGESYWGWGMGEVKLGIWD